MDKQQARNQAKKAEKMTAALADPTKFARGMLRHKLWTMQDQIMHSVASHPKTIVKACHASSKTFTAAELTLWWISRFIGDGVVLTIAPTDRQVRTQIWAEIHHAIARSVINFPPCNQKTLTITPNNYAMGIATDKAVNVQGWPRKNTLIIIDEAPGIEPEIWEAIETLRASGNVRILALGNPTDIGGPYYDAFHSRRHEWNCFTISAFETPNFRGVDVERLMQMPDKQLDWWSVPYLISRRWVKERYLDWGPDDPRWESRVLGEFPRAAGKAVIPLAAVEQCIDLELDWKKYPLIMGADIARWGDDNSAFVGNKGGRVLLMEEYHHQDTMETTGHVSRFYKELPIIRSFRIDEGNMGAGVVDRCFEMNLNVTPMSFGSSAYNHEDYLNLGTEIWWNMRRMFLEKRLSIPKSGGSPSWNQMVEKLISQLTSRKIKKYNSKGQIQLESKEEMKARGLPSPDLAEALGMSVYPNQWLSKVGVV